MNYAEDVGECLERKVKAEKLKRVMKEIYTVNIELSKKQELQLHPPTLSGKTETMAIEAFLGFIGLCYSNNPHDALGASEPILQEKKLCRYWTSLNNQLMSGPLRFSGTRSARAWHMSGNAMVASQ